MVVTTGGDGYCCALVGGGQDASKCPMHIGQPPTTQDFLAQNINSAEVEKHAIYSNLLPCWDNFKGLPPNGFLAFTLPLS